MIRRPATRVLAALLAAALLVACGGGGGYGGSSSSGGGGGSTTPNQVTATVDGGPPQVNAINLLYATVKVCAPGSTTLCQSIDHVQVDTGSQGFRVLATVLGSGVSPSQLPPTVDPTGNAIVECTQFVDGWSWGPVRSADLYVAGEVAHNVPIQVIGDPAYPDTLIPATCSNVVGGTIEDTVLQFQANGILGVNNFIEDCGPACAPGTTFTQDGSNYNACTASTPAVCTPTVVALSAQVSNPVAFFASDNNGVVITLPSVPAGGLAGVSGTLTFGIGTQANNALGSAAVYQLDPGSGTLFTQYNAVALNSSYLDSGSNALFFPDPTIPACAVSKFFYCPASPLSLTAVMQGVNGVTRSIAFAVEAADSFAANTTAAATLAGPTGSASTGTFDWGLPFFYGRSVYIVLETATVGGVAGPAIAF